MAELGSDSWLGIKLGLHYWSRRLLIAHNVANKGTF